MGRRRVASSIEQKVCICISVLGCVMGPILATLFSLIATGSGCECHFGSFKLSAPTPYIVVQTNTNHDTLG